MTVCSLFGTQEWGLGAQEHRGKKIWDKMFGSKIFFPSKTCMLCKVRGWIMEHGKY